MDGDIHGSGFISEYLSAKNHDDPGREAIMIGMLLSKFLGSGVSEITGSIRQMRKDKLDAQNAEQRIELDKEIAGLENRRAVLIAEAKSNWNVAVRAMFAFPFIVFLNKVIIYDKVLGLGATDDLSRDLWNIMMIVVGFFFVYENCRIIQEGSLIVKVDRNKAIMILNDQRPHNQIAFDHGVSDRYISYIKRCVGRFEYLRKFKKPMTVRRQGVRIELTASQVSHIRTDRRSNAIMAGVYDTSTSTIHSIRHRLGRWRNR